MPIKKTLEKSRKETTRSSKMREVGVLSNTFGTTITNIVTLEQKVENIIRNFGADRSISGFRNFNAAQDQDKDILNGFGADSLDIFELILELEFEFNIGVPDGVAVTLTTFNKIIQYLRFPVITVTWEYAFDENKSVKILPLRENKELVNSNVNPTQFTIQFKVKPVYATYNVTGTATATIVGSIAQLTLTGIGNFTGTGSISSPSITIIPFQYL
jgi:acyl carrier protein